jgi:hypothetical protein
VNCVDKSYQEGKIENNMPKIMLRMIYQEVMSILESPQVFLSSIRKDFEKFNEARQKEELF